MLWPAILIGVLTSLATLMMMNHTIPWASREIKKIVINGMEEIILKKLKVEKSVLQESVSIHVSRVENKTLFSPVIKYSNAGNEYLVTAESALISIDSENSVIDLTLINAILETTNSEAETNRLVLQGSNEFNLQLPATSRKRLGYHMTSSEIDSLLNDFTYELEFERKRVVLSAIMGLTQADFQFVVDRISKSKVKKIEKRIRKLSTEKHGRFAMSTSCLIFVLVGSTLASINASSHYLLSFLYCFLPTVCVYYPIVLCTIALSQNGTLQPQYAVWIGNGISVIVVVILVRKYHRN